MKFDYRNIVDADSLSEFMDFYSKSPRLNLGCNKDIREGYVNVDILDNIEGVNLVCDVRNLQFIPIGSCEHILAYDLLEHFPFQEMPKVLALWTSLLKPGGLIIVRVPDLQFIAQRLLEGKLPTFEAQKLIYGGQDYQFNFHMSGFTPDYLEGLLIASGCSEVVQKIKGIDETPMSHNITLVGKK